MSATPGELMEQIERDARSLDSGGRELAKAIQRLSDFELRYEQELQKALITIYHDAKEKGDRMPAEDVRKAMAHRKVPHDVYAAFLAEKAKVEALRAWLRPLEAALSARQSLLKVIAAEVAAAR